MALDVFKLDTIATALKKVDEVRLLCVCACGLGYRV